MELDFHWINLLILFGALQGLIFGIILLFNKKHPGARFLAAFMFVLAYNGFETFNWSSGLDRYTVILHVFPFVLIYGLGPSLYLYVTSLIQPEKRLSGKTVLAHYSPLLFQFCFRSVEIVYHILWVNNIFRGTITNAQVEQLYWAYSEKLSVMVFLGYLAATLYKFRMSDGRQVRSVSKEGNETIIRWIKGLLICVIILGIAWPLTVWAPELFGVAFKDEFYYPIELALVLFIYWIAMTGYHKSKLIYLKSYKDSGALVISSEWEKHLAQLQDAMQKDKLYLDPELNLNKVAAHTRINAKAISSILNRYHHTSFNDFINDYRIREVKERLMSPTSRHLTISGIAFESGFNSQATFQRAFKNATGMSPREYLNIQSKKTA
jgi:AraC-like DNA-binding protein